MKRNFNKKCISVFLLAFVANASPKMMSLHPLHYMHEEITTAVLRKWNRVKVVLGLTALPGLLSLLPFTNNKYAEGRDILRNYGRAKILRFAITVPVLYQ